MMVSRKEASEELSTFCCGCADSRMATIIGNGFLFIIALLLLLVARVEILESGFYDNFAMTERTFACIIISVLTVQLFIFGMAIAGAYFYRSGMVKISLELLTLVVTCEIGFGLLHLISRFNPIPLLICSLKAYILWFPMTAFINECDSLKKRSNSELLLFPIQQDDDDDEENGILSDHIRRRTSSQTECEFLRN